MSMARSIVLIVAAACCLCAIVAVPALAQDARGSAAQSAGLGWLKLTDRGDFAGSWASAGKQFQHAITAEKWGEALQKVRPPLGALVERSIKSTQFTKTFPGAPDGDYVLLVFRTSFAKKIDSRETVTLEREADGAWRVIGYFIR